MNLSTNYMGMELQSPIIIGASRITNEINNIKKCESYGAGAVVLKSLFEEQIIAEIDESLKDDSMYFWYPQAAEFVKSISKEHGIKEYLKLIEEAKSAVSIPVIASINCVGGGEWVTFAKKIEEAGADALELNIYIVPFDEKANCKTVSDTYKSIVEGVKKATSLPVAVKIGHNLTNITKMEKTLTKAGADALVLFNRPYTPDIDIENITVVSDNYYSTPAEISQSLRWISILSENTNTDLSASTGIHDHTGVIKQLLAGATTTQICSALYKHGLKQIGKTVKGLETWMKKKNYESIDDFRGKIHEQKKNTAAFERIQFIEKTTGVG